MVRCASSAKSADVGSVLLKDEHSPIISRRNIDKSIGANFDTLRVIQLTISISMCPEFADEGSVQIENLYAMIFLITNIKFRTSKTI